MDNFRITPNFTFFEATTTQNRKLLLRNREQGMRRIPKILLMCQLMERIRGGLGDIPIDVHSLFRCLELNGATAGSSSRSQHTKAEACDWSPGGKESYETCLKAFRTTERYLVRNRIMFGQLCWEEKEGRYWVAGKQKTWRKWWIHTSLGYPLRPLERCGEVLTYKKGLDDKKGTWALVAKHSFPEWKLVR